MGVKVYYFIEPDKDFFPIGWFVTEKYILEKYFPYFVFKMNEAGKSDKVTFDLCIDDFVIVNWAEEIEPG